MITILLVISNVFLWTWLIYEERWSRAVDDELEELHRRDKLKLNSMYGTMVSNNWYQDSDSIIVKENDNDNQSNRN